MFQNWVLETHFYAVFLTTFGLYFLSCYSLFFQTQKHMKSISPKLITYIAFGCLLLIFTTQAYLVLEYFQTTHSALTRESDAILLDGFRKDLTNRNRAYKLSIGDNNFVTPPPPTKTNTIKIDLRKTNQEQSSVIGSLDLIINNIVSKTNPLDIDKLDNIIESILSSRSVNSLFIIYLVDPKTNKILQQSQKGIGSSWFLIQSKLLNIDLENKQALQLVLVNPFGVIIKRMSLMLGTSLILSIICLLAFRFLLRVLAQQKQLVAFKNEFLGNIAHELKRPVASLSFNLDCLTLPDYSEKGEQRDLMLRKAINSTSEMNDSIQMIVALTRVEEGLLKLDKQPIDLRLMFDELKSRFLNSSYKKVQIETNYGEGVLTVTGDKQLLGQCFANLLDNAIKYSGKEPSIKIALENTDNAICVSIADNGHGIEADQLSVIFDKYTRVGAESRKISGFGIGLNYVKTIVEKHHGEVSASSEQGVGSEFRVVLPL